jgi:hypothetical protein
MELGGYSEEDRLGEFEMSGESRGIAERRDVMEIFHVGRLVIVRFR